MRLAERFGQWPLLAPAAQMTAAQAMLLAEALTERKTTETVMTKDGARRRSVKQPKMSRKRLLEITENIKRDA